MKHLSAWDWVELALVAYVLSFLLMMKLLRNNAEKKEGVSTAFGWIALLLAPVSLVAIALRVIWALLVIIKNSIAEYARLNESEGKAVRKQ